MSIESVNAASDFMKSHFQAIVMLSAGTLAIFGILLMANRLTWVTTQLQSIMRSVGLEWLVGLG
jgi:hypothetical protein